MQENLFNFFSYISITKYYVFHFTVSFSENANIFTLSSQRRPGWAEVKIK